MSEANGGWNYRIVKTTRKSLGEVIHLYGLCEVYYDFDGAPFMRADPETGWYEKPEEIAEGLRLMLKGAESDAPILDDWVEEDAS